MCTHHLGLSHAAALWTPEGQRYLHPTSVIRYPRVDRWQELGRSRARCRGGSDDRSSYRGVYTSSPASRAALDIRGQALRLGLGYYQLDERGRVEIDQRGGWQCSAIFFGAHLR